MFTSNFSISFYYNCKFPELYVFLIQEEGNETPLMKAAEFGFIEVVKILLDHGANLNFKNIVRLYLLQCIYLEV